MSAFGDPRLPQRFWDKVAVNAETGCWEWTASLNGSGYGQFGINHHPVLAHRHAFSTLVGPIGPGLDLDHLCRVRLCCNPAHVEPVTRLEHVHRSPYVISAQNAAKTHCPAGHEYDELNTLRNAQGHRFCRACKRASTRRSRAARALAATALAGVALVGLSLPAAAGGDHDGTIRLGWVLPDGGTPARVTWPQPVFTGQCGVWVQWDLYPYSTDAERARTDALLDDGLLTYGEDHGWAKSWTFEEQPPCVTPTQSPSPTQSPTPTATAEPSATPTPSVTASEPAPEPTAPSPSPTGPSPSAPTSHPSSSPTSTPSPTSVPTDSPSPSTTSSVPSPTPTSGVPSATPSDGPEPSAHVLAVTGVDPGVGLMAVAILSVLGVICWGLSRKARS
ncbi:hypothetical protein D1825_13230 [Cellulomonas rhizosphaerae]|uniref:HNH nuclease domain-containing protein n=1 Tax=Cellulomonas rhizosphaerae TaxID=2293719 RepID=A0A413RJC7_9CELL|nr:hypothetical protein D1825_13230 [Cellulomonas rhizosphaerae]